MNNQLTVIHQTEVLGHQFQIYGTAERPLFLAKDVAELIEHSDTSTMLRTVDDDEKETNNVCTLGGVQKSWFLTEHGLYEVLMQSRKPIAKQFKKKVKQILSEIRQRGVYTSKALSTETAVVLQSLNQTLQLAMRVMDSLSQFAQQQMAVTGNQNAIPQPTEQTWSLTKGVQVKAVSTNTKKRIPCVLKNVTTGEIKCFRSLRSALNFLNLPLFGMNHELAKTIQVGNWIFFKIER